MRAFGLITLLLILACGTAGAETLMERAKRDGIVMVAKGDAAMAAAMRKAREALPTFLKLANAPQRTMRGFAVKVAVVESDDAEFFWIAPFEQRKNDFAGQINNTPRLVKKVKFGQTITFREDEIVDWMYVDGGKMIGNFTACVLLKREPPEQAAELMKKIGLSCDL
jgi:uncharacterized protein YegJ (DUF2314 family)